MTPIVGFVGLGSIGAPMASRVAQRFDVVAFDVDPGRAAGRDDLTLASDLGEVATASDLVCLSLPTAEASIDVVERLVGVGDARARVIVELSTVGPGAVETCAQIAHDSAWRLVDAPVSGGIRRAATGELATMVSGQAEDIEFAMPVLKQIAQQVFVMGERPGLGQVMKLANNIIALSALPITSEAISFGGSHGLDPQAMIDVINASTGRTQRSEVMFPTSIIPQTFDYGAYGEITQKDVALFVEAARQAGTSVHIAEEVEQLYDAFVAAHPRTDYSYLHRYIEELGDRPDDQPGASAR